MSTDPTDQHLDGIVTALLNRDWEHRDLYARNAGFRMQLDWLVGLLPGIIDGMATNANAAEAARQEAIKQAHWTTPAMLIDGDGLYRHLTANPRDPGGQ